MTADRGLRSRSASATIAAAGRLMLRLGIARVTDITALDKLGLPVYASVRPRGLTARIHAGKGLTAADAHVGALMEAVECALAESASVRGPYVRMLLGELARRLPRGLSLSDFAPRVGVELPQDRPVLAVRCFDLLGKTRTLLPAELLMLPGPDEDAPPLFGWSSNGLACGSTLQEATLHALFEVLERDAIAMSRARGSAMFVAADSLPEPVLGLARSWQTLGVRLLLRCLPSDFGLPCFEATLHEPGHAQAELARGWGLHMDRDLALARAVCEAAQSRLCRIHSERRGMAALYESRRLGDRVATQAVRATFLAGAAEARTAIDFASVPFQHAPRSATGALKDLLARLGERGFRHVFRLRMAGTEAASLGLHVVKLVVPGCEDILASRQRAGPRLLAQLGAGT